MSSGLEFIVVESLLVEIHMDTESVVCVDSVRRLLFLEFFWKLREVHALILD